MIRTAQQLLLLAIVATVAIAGEKASRIRENLPELGPLFSDFRFARGDNLEWARRDFDDRGWQRIRRVDVPSRDGIYWLRFRLTTSNQPSEHPRDLLSLAVVASYEVFWDGRLIGRNGHIGANAAEERPGIVDAAFRIPEELNGPGEHLVALRMSSFHTGFPGPTYGVTPRIVALPDHLRYRVWTSAFSLIAVGAALVVGLVFGLLWLLTDRWPATAVFSVACFVAAVQQTLQAARGLIDYPYSWHYPRLLAIALLIGLLGLLLVAFLQLFFRARGTWWRLVLVLGLMIAAWQVSPLYNGKAAAMSWAALAVALGVTIGAWRAQRRGAIYVFAGLLLSVIGLARSPVEFLEHSFVFSSGAAMLGCIVALTLQLRDERRAARQAQLTAARLEIELLKKNIQPHFVLNTLATIMEVIEQDAKAAVELIEALASEFRILNRVSGEKLIALEQEIELCRAHLRVMARRKGARCALHVEGANAAAQVPPALFLTLVENGLTHLLPRDGKLEFTLRAESLDRFARYTFTAHGTHQHPIDPTTPPREGTGLRYLKARLEESFTGHWSVTSGPTVDGWKTVIAIANPSLASATRTSHRTLPDVSTAGELA